MHCTALLLLPSPLSLLQELWGQRQELLQRLGLSISPDLQKSNNASPNGSPRRASDASDAKAQQDLRSGTEGSARARGYSTSDASSPDGDTLYGPQLVNLSDDPQLCARLVYTLRPGLTRVGRDDAPTPQVSITAHLPCALPLPWEDMRHQDIILGGINIQACHALIYWSGENREVMVQPLEGALVYHNGSAVGESARLQNGDR